MKFTLNPHIPKGVNDIFLDSSGFTLMSKWGDFPFSVEQYAEFLKEKGSLFDYAATMDYPCEPKLINIPVNERIRRTIENTEILLNNYDFQCKIVPVIQGWKLKEYIYEQNRLEGDSDRETDWKEAIEEMAWHHCEEIEDDT